jgi:hypothetical protein
MAESMSSNEIEDVLSSIRRLVAQDLKPADRVKLAAVADATQKLVLAPEQRVEDVPSKFSTVRRPSRRAAFPPVDMVLAGVAAAAGGGPRPEADDWPAPTSDIAEKATSATVDADFAAIAAEFDAAPRHMAQALAEEAPEFVLDPNARLYDVAPQEFAAGEVTGGAVSGAESAAAPPRDSTAWQDPEPDDVQPQHFEMDSEATAPDSQSLHGNIEPDSAWADEVERRVIEELAGKPAQNDDFAQSSETFRDQKFSGSSHQATPEVLFDEDVLRAMVQAILRDEMAGALGERITRNIRKLVRAEVGRILAAQELE